MNAKGLFDLRKVLQNLPDVQESRSEGHKNPPGDEKNRQDEQHSKVSDSANEGCRAHWTLEDLSREFRSMLKKNLFADVIIRCGSEVFRAHKSILCTRSSVFEAMFTSDMQESKDNTVVVDDIDASVFRDVLRFMYTGKLTSLSDLRLWADDVSFCYDLLYAAEKYQIKALKRLCIVSLKGALSEENAFQYLQCADLYDKELKGCALSYISEKFSTLKETEEWKKLQSDNPALALEVYTNVFDKLQVK